MSSFNRFGRVLTWADFNDVQPKPVDTGEGASIGVTWDEEHEPGRKGNEIYVKNLIVNVIMPDPTMNTIVVTKKTEAMRKHEQGHYDIIALGAREFYNKALKLKAASDTELTEKIDELFTEVKDRADVVDARYDTQTNHHINQTVQAAWDTAIANAKANPNGTVADLPQ